MTIEFSYDKKQVIQALRYHFITRREIRFMIILVNVFALFSAALFFFRKIQPLAFLVSSFVWFSLMLSFWFFLPYAVYRRAKTFKDSFKMTFDENHLFLETRVGSRSWAWREFSNFLETPHFFHLYFDARTFFLVPKQAFLNSDELHNVRMLLKEKIKNK